MWKAECLRRGTSSSKKFGARCLASTSASLQSVSVKTAAHEFETSFKSSAETPGTSAPQENPHDKLIRVRQGQARRTVLIRADIGEEVEMRMKEAIVKETGEAHGIINKFAYYRGHYITELQSMTAVNKLMRTGARHVKDSSTVVPSRNRVLSFFPNDTRNSRSTLENSKSDRLAFEKKEIEVMQKMRDECTTISEQMQYLALFDQQSDTGVRLRFFLASMIEDCFRSLFPFVQLRPFGSTVNGYGSDRSDLDLQLILDNAVTESPNAKFVFQANRRPDEHLFSSQTLEVLRLMLAQFVPGISNILFIRGARVPIVRFTHELSGIHCDISVQNPPMGCDMSRLFFTFGLLDERVKSLVTSVRRWGQTAKLVDSGVEPAKLSNFQLMTLAFFYLQQMRNPILPPITDLLSNQGPASPYDSRLQLNGNASAPHSASAPNPMTREELLLGFLDFYTDFDFEKRGICLTSGKAIEKPTSDYLFIRNPVELGHNIGKNVYTVGNFVAACRSSFKTLSESRTPQKEDSWGLTRLLDATVTHPGEDVVVRPGLDWTQLLEPEDIGEEKHSSKKAVPKSESFSLDIDEVKIEPEKGKKHSRTEKPMTTVSRRESEAPVLSHKTSSAVELIREVLASSPQRKTNNNSMDSVITDVLHHKPITEQLKATASSTAKTTTTKTKSSKISNRKEKGATQNSKSEQSKTSIGDLGIEEIISGKSKETGSGLDALEDYIEVAKIDDPLIDPAEKQQEEISTELAQEDTAKDLSKVQTDEEAEKIEAPLTEPVTAEETKEASVQEISVSITEGQETQSSSNEHKVDHKPEEIIIETSKEATDSTEASKAAAETLKEAEIIPETTLSESETMEKLEKLETKEENKKSESRWAAIGSFFFPKK